MRWLLLLVTTLAGCESRYVARPLPELVVPEIAKPITTPQLALIPGERFVFAVHHKGFTIARAELVVDEWRVHSRLRTTQLAQMFATVEHELTTTLDRERTRPLAATETLAIDGKRELVETAFDGARYAIAGKARSIPGGRAHNVHTALGALRAWATPGGAAGYLFVVVAGELYRLDAEPPRFEDLRGTRTLRFDARVRMLGDGSAPIAVAMWLSLDDARVPLRIELAQDAMRLAADKLDE
ncbi:MAG: DUF3108 domain-containing protein [Deltaproteobacteria bacterium]|nr:DUF3108 domain-containing protein [Deltaproteobacteria bacterium]MDQ3301356.1 DUF3108 domain-containing protein [Myxococcota bacterium]